MKEFNTTGVCIPSKHYMVDISGHVEEIKKLVDAGKYFTMNRARQYGKTTTLNVLRSGLMEDYFVVSISFQRLAYEDFLNEHVFSNSFLLLLEQALSRFDNVPDCVLNVLEKIHQNVSKEDYRFLKLFIDLQIMIREAPKPFVLIIDEVDSATDNQVFLDFLAQLREGYISRDTDGVPAFHSVILAGVTDIKHIRSKIRDDKQHKVNSPWNIATDFNVDMSLSSEGIRGMLDEYESDHKTGMDTGLIARKIWEYTSGYPFLVSRICELIDKEVSQQFGSLAKAWTLSGIEEAVKRILSERNTLFQSLTGKLTNYPELKSVLHKILMEGLRIPYNPFNEAIGQMEMYGFVSNVNGTVTVSNRIFETLLYNLFLSDEELKNNVFGREGDLAKNIFVTNGKLNMYLILEHFRETYAQVFGSLQDKFSEKDGRELFLLYLKPIINGTGNYYIEAQTRDQTRTDVVVDYLGQQYIVELKIWRGPRYNAEGEEQLKEYLEHFNLEVGYMLSFNFNKHKEPGMKQVKVGSKIIFEETI